MILRRLFLERFMNHERTVLDVPEHGLFVVTGENGSGKSSLIETVSHALWGKSLRGKVGWRNTKLGSRAGVVLADGTKITRKREAHRSHVEIKRGRAGDDGDVYDTATKAQRAIDQEWGTFDVWRRSCVFSSSDSAHFSEATDGERKRLLEVVLGLERFDPALAQCRDELKGMRGRVETCAREAEAADRMIEAEGRRHAEAKADLDALVEPTPEAKPEAPKLQTTVVQVPEPPDLEAGKQRFADLKIVEARLAEIGEEIAELAALNVESHKQKAGNDARVTEARSNFGELGDAVRCPTCRQDVSEKHRGRLKSGLDAFVAERKAENTKIAAKVSATRAEISDLEAERGEQNAKRDRIQSDITLGRSDARRYDEAQARVEAVKERDERDLAARLETYRSQCAAIDRRHAAAVESYSTQAVVLRSRIREAGERMLDIEDGQDEAAANLEAARADVDELAACEIALGLKGIRAQVLGRALDGIQAVANLWLERICGPGLSLTLKPYAEKKSGKGVTDSISLVIEGAGAGEYLGASSGERRRLDVALLLALAEVTRAAAGNDPGTCFFDEVFDALDDDGQAAVADAIVAAFVLLTGADAFDDWRMVVPDNVPADVLSLADPFDPVAQSHLWEAVFPAIPHNAIVNMCILESGCRRIKPTSRYYIEGTAIHKLDRKAGESSYRGAYRRGFLQGCEFWPDPAEVDTREDPTAFYETASTRGNFGMIAAFNIRRLGPCVPLEALDAPFFSAWSAAVKIDRICKRYVKVRRRPCTVQAVRCAWAQAKWGSSDCGRVIRKMKKVLGKSRMRKRIDPSYHPTLADFRSAHDAQRSAEAHR